MAPPYVSQLEDMRKRALSEGITIENFWQQFNTAFTETFLSFPSESDDFKQYRAERGLYKVYWPRVFFPGHNPNSAYKRTIHVIQKKAIEEGKTYDEFDDICSRYVEVGELVQKVVGVELTQWLIEKLIWLELWGTTEQEFPGFIPDASTKFITALISEFAANDQCVTEDEFLGFIDSMDHAELNEFYGDLIPRESMAPSNPGSKRHIDQIENWRVMGLPGDKEDKED